MSHPIVNAGFRCPARRARARRAGRGHDHLRRAGADDLPRRKTEQFLAGKPWDQETLRAALAVLKQEVRECTDRSRDGRGRHQPRRTGGSWRRTSSTSSSCTSPLAVDPEQVDAGERVGGRTSTTGRCRRGSQEHTEYPELFPVTQPIIKRAAFVQATGEVTLHAGRAAAGRRPARGDGQEHAAARPLLVHAARPPTSSAPGAAAADSSPASRRSSRWPTSRRRGNNLIGLGEDDPVFSDGVVTSVGAPIGLAVAETIATARAAAAFIEQECIAYEDLPAVLTLDEAIAQNTAMPMIRKASDPDEDVQQRIPAVTRPGSDLDWLADPSRPAARHRAGDRHRSGPGRRPTSTSRRCAPWPSPACTTR